MEEGVRERVVEKGGENERNGWRMGRQMQSNEGQRGGRLSGSNNKGKMEGSSRRLSQQKGNREFEPEGRRERGK